jgi:hypothetical protein
MSVFTKKKLPVVTLLDININTYNSFIPEPDCKQIIISVTNISGFCYVAQKEMAILFSFGILNCQNGLYKNYFSVEGTYISFAVPTEIIFYATADADIVVKQIF